MRFNPQAAARQAQLDNLNQREGTHNTATYRSASLALFKLIHHYLVLNQDSPSSPMAEMSLEKFDKLRKYVETWAEQHSVDDLGDLFHSKFVKPMEAILSSDEKVIFQEALMHAALGKKPFAEKTNEAVWRVDETAFNDRHLQVPLQLVLIIVVMALVDFKHAPILSGQTEAEVTKDRLKMIFNALKEQLDDSVCALGVRHHLLFLVQNVFDGGLGIVVDEDTILVDELKRRVLGEIEEKLNKQLLQEFLADNLSTASLIEMARAQGLQQQLKKRLETLGIYEKERQINEYIAALVSLIPDKLQQPMLYALRLLQGEVKVLPANLAQKAQAFLANLIANFNPESDRAKLITLTDMIEKLLLILTQARFLKWLTPELQTCWDDLQNFINLPDLERMLEQYAAHLADIDKLCGAIRRWQSSNRVERVQKFFRDWKEESLAKMERDNLAAFLFDPAFYAVIKLSKENIADLTKASGDLNEYEINRIFLYGLLTPRQEWSENFNKLLSILFRSVKNPALKGVLQEQLKWMQDPAAWRQNELVKMANEPDWRKIAAPIPGYGVDGYDGRLVLTAPFLASCLQENPDCFSRVLIAAKERVILASPAACEAVIRMIGEHPQWPRDQKYKLVQMQQTGWDPVLCEALAWGNDKGVEVYLAALLKSSLFSQLSQDQKKAVLLVSNQRKEVAWVKALQENKVEALKKYLTVILSAGVCQDLGVFVLQAFIMPPAADWRQLFDASCQQFGESALQVYFECILSSDFFHLISLEDQADFLEKNSEYLDQFRASPQFKKIYDAALAEVKLRNSQPADNISVLAILFFRFLPNRICSYLKSDNFKQLNFAAKLKTLNDFRQQVDQQWGEVLQNPAVVEAYQSAVINLQPDTEKERDQQKRCFMSLYGWIDDVIVELADDLQGEAIDFAPQLQSSFSSFLRLFAAEQANPCALLRKWAITSDRRIPFDAYHLGLFQAWSSAGSGPEEDLSASRGTKRSYQQDPKAEADGESHRSNKVQRRG